VRLVEVTPLAVTVGVGGGRLEPGVERVGRRLAELGVDSSRQTLMGGDPSTRLDRFTRDFPNSVLVVVSSRWTGRKPRWHSTGRTVARRSSCPVLAVPAVR
jgi:nucleotide-binding universal stress UspA family protein